MSSPTLVPEAKLIRAIEVDTEARKIEAANKKNFVKLGQLMLECEEKELWRELRNTDKNHPQFNQPFRSFDEWTCDAISASRSSGYEAKRAIARLLEAKIDPETAQDVPRANLNLLTTKLPASDRAEYLAPARSLSERDLRKVLQRERPALHIEDVERVRLKFDRSQFETFMEGMKVLAWALEDPDLSRENGIEAVFIDWLDSKCEREGYTRLSNREAFRKATKKSDNNLDKKSKSK